MITIQDLEKKQEQCEASIAPFSEEFKKIKAKFEELCKIKEQPFLDLLEQFYDEQLLDIDNNSVKVGNIISKAGIKYEVVNRGTQFVFGQICNTPRVMVIKVNKLVVKEKHILRSDLKSFKIIS